MNFGLVFLVILALASPFSLMAGEKTSDQSDKSVKMKKETYTGSIIVTGLAGGVPSAMITIYIHEYTTDEEAAQLAQILKTEGQKELVKKLSKIEKGRIIIGGKTGYNFGFARSFKTETGRIIRLATDRPIYIPEARLGSRSMDYSIGYVELNLDAEGKGNGTMIFGAKISFKEDNTLKVEQYGVQPARLMNIRMRK